MQSIWPCNGVRKAAAKALVDWLQGDQTGANCLSLAIMGTLNSNAKEEPIEFLEVNCFINTQPPGAYSDVSDGKIGILNYILVSRELQSYLIEAQVYQH